MDQHHDDLFESAENATDKGMCLKLPRYQNNLKHSFDGLYSYSTKTAHLDLPGRIISKLGRWSPNTTAHYNCTRCFLEDH